MRDTEIQHTLYGTNFTMSTLLSLRRALGKAVDELPPLAGTKDFKSARPAW